MEGVLVFVVMALAAAAGGLAYYVHLQDRASRYARLGAVACGICGRDGVEERGGGSYFCGACGYDTDTTQPPERAALVHQLQELAIAQTCLESARSELSESRERVHTVRRDGRTRKEKVGPFHDRYLEGIEQAEEASGILQRLVDERPALGPALEAIGSIEPPPDGAAGFNARVSAACKEVDLAHAAIGTERRALVQVFRG